MMLKHFSGLLLLIPFWLGAQEVSLSGESSDYAGALLEIILSDNPIIDRPLRHDSLRCNEKGRFQYSFPLEEARIIQIRTGIYDARLFVEPGKAYRLDLPPHRELAYEEVLSPYFQRSQISLRPLDDPEDMNHRIFAFDSLFDISNDLIITARRLNKVLNLDSMILSLESGFETNSSAYFDRYRLYKYGILRLNEGSTSLQELAETSLGPEIDEHNPAYLELFSFMYRDFLFYYAQTPEGSALRKLLNRAGSIDSIRHIISRHPSIMSPQQTDLVILASLANVFHKGQYHKESILRILDSLAADPVHPGIERWSRQIKSSLESLMIGHYPPPINSVWKKNLENCRGKYVYLLFCTPEHYGCMMEYPFLQSYFQKHRDYLEVITVMVGRNRESVDQFMQRNGYSWKNIYYADLPGILEAYRIRAFPTAYLLDQDGRLLQSPAALPSDRFEENLFRIMRSRKEL